MRELPVVSYKVSKLKKMEQHHFESTGFINLCKVVKKLYGL